MLATLWYFIKALVVTVRYTFTTRKVRAYVLSYL